MESVILGTVVITIVGWELTKLITRALIFYGFNKLKEDNTPPKVNHNDFVISESGQSVRKKEYESVVKQSHDAFYGQYFPMKYSIESHGNEGNYALYFGRSMNTHGARLCNMSDFDAHGKATRELIEKKLNADKLP